MYTGLMTWETENDSRNEYNYYWLQQLQLFAELSKCMQSMRPSHNLDAITCSIVLTQLESVGAAQQFSTAVWLRPRLVEWSPTHLRSFLITAAALGAEGSGGQQVSLSVCVAHSYSSISASGHSRCRRPSAHDGILLLLSGGAQGTVLPASRWPCGRRRTLA